jgi:Ca2+-binding RTX toxin-like protein
VILGLGGNDTLDGGTGLSVMDGGEGDDTFVNVGFGQVIVGGAGIDTVGFNVASATSDLAIDIFTGEGAGGSWTGIEAVTGVLGHGDDVVTTGFQLLSIYGGDDTLLGGLGNDTLVGNAGAGLL